MLKKIKEDDSMGKKSNKGLISIITILLGAVGLGGYGITNQSSPVGKVVVPIIQKIEDSLGQKGAITGKNTDNNQATNTTTTTTTDSKSNNPSFSVGEVGEYQNGQPAYKYLNGNKSGLQMNWTANKIEYGNLDNLKRATNAKGFLDINNLVKSETRTAQRFNPTGWSNKPLQVNGRRVFPQNRGHLLAYSVTGNFDDNGKYTTAHPKGSLDNPKNLVSQSEFSNQRIFTQKNEPAVRKAMAIKGNKVIYEVTPVYKGNELMPRAIKARAKDTKGTLDFNLLVYNVEPGVKFNYADGTSVADASVNVPTKFESGVIK